MTAIVAVILVAGPSDPHLVVSYPGASSGSLFTSDAYGVCGDARHRHLPARFPHPSRGRDDPGFGRPEPRPALVERFSGGKAMPELFSVGIRRRRPERVGLPCCGGGDRV